MLLADFLAGRHESPNNDSSPQDRKTFWAVVDLTGDEQKALAIELKHVADRPEKAATLLI